LKFRPKILPAAFGFLTMVWLAGTAVAHHSTAMFEWGKEVTIDGTINKWEWTQPHTFIWLDVPGEKGTVDQYALEGMSPSWLGRRGWDRKSITAGEKVKIVYYPLKDGRKGGFYVRVLLADGRTLEAFPKQVP
jgi:hypothetical protein